MGCSNCFNGCATITSDQCIKYTGESIPDLGIENGDSLAVVEKSITDTLLSIVRGEIVLASINEEFLCDFIKQFFPEGEDITVDYYVSGLVRAACVLDEEIGKVNTKFDNLNSEYEVGCVTDVSDDTNTHIVLQKTIEKLCSVNTTLNALINNLPSTYVKIEDFDDLITEYLAGNGSAIGVMAAKMVPYAAVEYYGPISGYPTEEDGFNGDGAGFGAWKNVYLCNGSNNTPDKRGRVAVGVTDGTMGGGAMNSSVQPGANNPTITLSGTFGSNVVTLTSVAQIPSHTHTATVAITEADHYHWTVGQGGNERALEPYGALPLSDRVFSFPLTGTTANPLTARTSGSSSGIHINVSNGNSGGSAPHENIQPSIGCYYIMYIPS